MTNHKLKLANSAESNICNTCGTRHSNPSPATCLIREDDRQYVPVSGQAWTSYNELKKTRNFRINQLTDNLYDMRVNPAFGIGQKAHLILSDEGNLLWDCLAYLDEQTVAFIQAKGGLRGMAISHPHYYTLMSVWAETFDCPIYLHQADSQWVMDNNAHIKFWEEEKLSLFGGMQIIHTGGHFPGSCVLHAPAVGASGGLFVGDTLQISLSRQFISMMHSYPNIIPLPLKDIQHIHAIVSALNFDAMYGAFEWQNIASGAKAIFERSFEKYLEIYTGK